MSWFNVYYHTPSFIYVIDDIQMKYETIYNLPHDCKNKMKLPRKGHNMKQVRYDYKFKNTAQSMVLNKLF